MRNRLCTTGAFILSVFNPQHTFQDMFALNKKDTNMQQTFSWWHVHVYWFNKHNVHAHAHAKKGIHYLVTENIHVHVPAHPISNPEMWVQYQTILVHSTGSSVRGALRLPCVHVRGCRHSNTLLIA